MVGGENPSPSLRNLAKHETRGAEYKRGFMTNQESDQKKREGELLQAFNQLNELFGTGSFDEVNEHFKGTVVGYMRNLWYGLESCYSQGAEDVLDVERKD